MRKIFETDSDGYEFVEEQRYLREDLEGVKAKLLHYDTMESFSILDEKLFFAITDIDELINSFSDLQEEETIPSTVDNFDDSTSVIIDRILFNLLEAETIRSTILAEVESEKNQAKDDKFNFGFSISNIGPTIDFVDVDQADPSPTNMRLGIFAQLYNDGYNKVNFLLDANKLLVTRYPMMDWDGDGMVGGYDEFGAFLGEREHVGEYNADGEQEYDTKGYMDDPWYLAIVTAWLDDWYLGGDIDYAVDGIHDRRIGGYSCSGEVVKQSLEVFECSGDWFETKENEEFLDFSDPGYGVYGEANAQGRAKKEKGSGDNRSFTRELEEMIYNVGLEYWYTDAFALRTGYIYDFEGKIFNPTFGAGIRLLQYGFDFGYTAGETGHPRANTMFFSINFKIN
jgi:hypothetical protein